MIAEQNNMPPQATGGALRWCRRNTHFLIAVLVLGGTAIGWGWATGALEWVMHKEAVPWPSAVRVNTKEFRLESLPQALGPYFLAADGELFRNPDGSSQRDGKPDGEIRFDENLMEELKIGTPLDKMRVAERRSNWYVSRLYVDPRKNPGEPYRFWQLDVTYYTGGLDKVPHVPERCLAAAGATVLDGNDVMFRAPGMPEPWDGDIPFRATRFERRDPDRFRTDQFVQYYAFSLNGRPQSSWKVVRLLLNDPRLRYCYFAKIQLAPRNPTNDFAQADKATADFASHCLPSVLRMLPMPRDIESLYSAERSKQN